MAKQKKKKKKNSGAHHLLAFKLRSSRKELQEQTAMVDFLESVKRGAIRTEEDVFARRGWLEENAEAFAADYGLENAKEAIDEMEEEGDLTVLEDVEIEADLKKARTRVAEIREELISG